VLKLKLAAEKFLGLETGQLKEVRQTASAKRRVSIVPPLPPLCNRHDPVPAPHTSTVRQRGITTSLFPVHKAHRGGRLKAPRFAYARPASIAEAIALLDKHRDRRARARGRPEPGADAETSASLPEVLVDHHRIAALAGIRSRRPTCASAAHTPRGPRALRRYSRATCRSSRPIRTSPPRDPQPRHSGAVAPWAIPRQLPACALALRAELRRRRTKRRAPHRGEILQSLYATALKGGELLIAAEFPLPNRVYASGFGELARRTATTPSRDRRPRLDRGGKFSDMARCSSASATGLARSALRPRARRQAAEREDHRGARCRSHADLAPRADLLSSAATKLHLAKVQAAGTQSIGRRRMSAPAETIDIWLTVNGERVERSVPCAQLADFLRNEPGASNGTHCRL